MRAQLITSAITTFALVTPTFALPVNYDESVSGDLALAVQPTLFTLDVGVNTVTGSTSAITNVFNDFDPFSLTVPAGMQITSIDLSMNDTFGDMISGTWRIRQGSTELNGGTLLESLIANSPGSTSSTLGPFPAGDYNIAHGSLSRTVGVDSGATFTFNINVVPEPASLSLISLGSMMLIRRRR